MKSFYLTLFIALLFSSCGVEQKQRELAAKEEALNKREQELNLRQQSIQQQEAQLLKKDSSANEFAVVNDTLPGTWNVQMVGTESSCPGSAVGDTKKEVWTMNYQGNHLVARSMAGEQVTRVYTGIFTGNTIELIDRRPATPNEPATTMVVRLFFKGPALLEGHREIIRSDCRVMYSVKAEKQP